MPGDPLPYNSPNHSIHSVNVLMGIAAILSSRVLAQRSTVRNADGLICRVRNESGSFPVAMAAMPIYILIGFAFIKLNRRQQQKTENLFISNGKILHIGVPLFYLRFYRHRMHQQKGHVWGAAPSHAGFLQRSVIPFCKRPGHCTSYPITEPHGRNNKTDTRADTVTSEY